MFGCAGQPDEPQQIVDNLLKAGFLADDIMVVGGKVYVGRDAEVSLAASREMLGSGDTSEEQYRTNNLVSTSLSKICINGSTFTGAFSTALDLAIQNYDELPLTFAMARTPSTGCSFTINAVIQPGVVGGSAGFPSGGLPYHTINIGGGLSSYSVDVIEHVITHEIGHTLGFRHSDYYNRSISCGTGGNEGGADVGAILISGTPTTATVGGSLMNSCFRNVETGEFTSGDITALTVLYKQKGAAKRVIRGFFGKCLDADATSSGTNGTRIQLWDCNGWDNQNWQLLADGTIRSVGGKCLDADANNSGANGTRVQLWDCNGWDNQKWQLLADGTIRSVGGKCLDADANSSGANGTSVQLWDCIGWENQKWRPLTYGTIRGVGGKCLDADATSSGANGTRVQLWDCNGWDNQNWQLLADGTIRSVGGKCLDADANNSGANGTRVQLWDCNGWDNQKWQLLADGTLRSVGGKCLDADANSSGANGTSVQLWDCIGWENQKWVVDN
ncbi:peptidase, M27 (PrtB) family [Cystobacter fuscus DSM 2262]|uniref:Peptidase, M27 (PrtB) family n=2 Tax=Cystobacter fuscus TaxID=43 RepID=S9Q2U2_CYSF2|nr:peptidase, M27 (PrtB) family [Cystobacter fuscus DSM 2262]